MVIGNKTYYDIIKEILELNYHHKGNVVLFKCDWVDNRVQDKWVKTDQFGITSVNFKHLFNTGEKISDEPFILASQALQVYYIHDPIDTDWAAVIQSKPRDVYDFDNLDSEHIDNDNGLFVPLPNVNGNVTVDIINAIVPSIRADIDGIIVDKKNLEQALESKYCLNNVVALIFSLELAMTLISFICFRKKMASTRGNNEGALAYEQQRLATIASNKRVLDSQVNPKDAVL